MKTLFLGDISPTAISSPLFKEKNTGELFKDTVSVFNDKDFIFANLEVGRNYITDKQFTDVRTLLAMFNTEIGLPNIQYEKKERLIQEEAIANNAETDARLDTWLEWLNMSIGKVHDLYPDITLSVKRHEFIKGGAAYGNIEDHFDRLT